LRVTIRRETTVGEMRAEMAEKYGSMEALRRHVKRHPKDFLAKVALHDAQEYRADPSSARIHQTRQIIIPDASIDLLTVQRLQLLLTVKGLGGTARSLRALAKAVARDVKNVSEDVRALEELGLLVVEDEGPGKPSHIRLAGQRIELHLVEA
jgi:hypothetical protein